MSLGSGLARDSSEVVQPLDSSNFLSISTIPAFPSAQFCPCGQPASLATAQPMCSSDRAGCFAIARTTGEETAPQSRPVSRRSARQRMRMRSIGSSQGGEPPAVRPAAQSVTQPRSLAKIYDSQLRALVRAFCSVAVRGGETGSKYCKNDWRQEKISESSCSLLRPAEDHLSVFRAAK